eukprot:g33436.t1
MLNVMAHHKDFGLRLACISCSYSALSLAVFISCSHWTNLIKHFLLSLESKFNSAALINSTRVQEQAMVVANAKKQTLSRKSILLTTTKWFSTHSEIFSRVHRLSTRCIT